MASQRRRRSSAATADALGLVESTSYLRLIALFLHALLTVAYLVWINASGPFLLSTLESLPEDSVGSATSRLLLADEATALALYLPVGTLSDWWGLRRNAVAAYGLVAAALVAYVRAPTLAWLTAVRVVFAIGGSTLVTTMSALLLRMSAIPDEVIYGTTSPPLSAHVERYEDRVITEESRLLSGRRGSGVSYASAKSLRKSSRSAGVLAFAGGLGAVVAVFGFLRLPVSLSRFDGSAEPDSPASLRFGLRATFDLLAVVALLQALFLAWALPSGLEGEDLPIEPTDATPPPLSASIREAGSRLVEGFRLAAQDGNIALGFASSFASRAQTTVTNAFLPLLIERYFSKYHLCDPAESPLVPPGSVTRDACRRAYLLASALTGTVQLLSLVLSPLIGFLTSSNSLSLSRRARHPQAGTLGLATLIGAAALVGLAVLPRDGDPRSGLTWVYASGIGLAQAAGVVLSLALVTTGRGLISAEQGGREVAGTLSGAYGFSGGLGILLIGSVAGFGFDRWPGAPFALMALIDLAVALGSAVLYSRS